MTETDAPHTEHGIQHLPITLFASVMGLSGFTIATEQLAPVLGIPDAVSVALLILSSVVWLGIAGGYVVKWVRFPESVRAELNHPIRLSFFPASSIGLILISAAAYQYLPAVAVAIWWVAITLQLMFTLVVLYRWMHVEHFTTEHNSPAWFIPIVANILVPILGPRIGQYEISYFFFAVGMVFWIPLLAISLNRSFFFAPIPKKLMPTLFILIVPPAIGFVAWTSLHDGELDDVGRILYYVALFMTLMVVSQARRFIGLPFALSWWAFSFPIASVTIATTLYAELTGETFFAVLSVSFYAVLAVVMVLLVVKTFIALMRRELLVPEG